MFRKIIAEGRLKLYNKYHNIVVSNILENPEWQAEDGQHFKDQFNAWWTIMNGEDIDEITDILCEGMRNL